MYTQKKTPLLLYLLFYFLSSSFFHFLKKIQKQEMRATAFVDYFPLNTSHA